MKEITMFISMASATVFSFVLLRFYLNSFFGEKDNKIKAALGWIPFCIWQCFINLDIYAMSMPPGIRLLFTIGTAALVIIITYQGEIWKKGILLTAYMALWMVLEMLVWFYLGVDNARTYALAVSVVSKILLLAIIMGIRFFMNSTPQNNETAINGRGLITIPLVSIALCYIMVEIGQEAGAGKTRIKVCLIVGALLLIVVNLSMLYVKLMENRISQNSAFYINQMEAYKQQHIEEAVAEIRETRHNFKQTFIYLKMLAAQGDKNFQEALASTVDDTLAKGKIVGVTGCFPVDAVLLKVMQVSQERNIRFSPCLKIPSDLAINDNDLCVLLGNALDNAIEAVEPLAESLREIYLEMEYNKGILDIRIKNLFQGELEWIEFGKRLKSKKPEKGHGLGLKSMYKIVSKYHGKMYISQEDDAFCLEIWMYA